MTTELKSFEKLAVEAIKKGQKWNGKFYDYGKKGTFIFIANRKYQIVNKQAFFNALGLEGREMTYADAYSIGALDRDWETYRSIFDLFL